MTGYTLSLGYNSSADAETAGKRLLAIVADLRANHGVILDEALRFDPAIDTLGEDLDDYAAAYHSANMDMTVWFTEDERGPVVHQSASGGNPSRKIKEAMRRAFCRLVITAMHRDGCEVCLNVH